MAFARGAAHRRPGRAIRPTVRRVSQLPPKEAPRTMVITGSAWGPSSIEAASAIIRASASEEATTTQAVRGASPSRVRSLVSATTRVRRSAAAFSALVTSRKPGSGIGARSGRCETGRGAAPGTGEGADGARSSAPRPTVPANATRASTDAAASVKVTNDATRSAMTVVLAGRPGSAVALCTAPR